MMDKDKDSKTISELVKIMIENDIKPTRLIGSYIDTKNKPNQTNLTNVAGICKTLKISRAQLYALMKEGLPYEKQKENKIGRVFNRKKCKEFIKQRESLKKRSKKIQRENII